MERGRWAWIAWGITMAIVLARPLLSLVPGGPDESFLEYLFVIGAVVAFATVGALITSRQPGNRVGLLFTILAGAAAISVTSGAYGSLAASRDLPFLGLAAWLSQLTFGVMLGPLAFLFLLFPTGRVPTRRWRWVLRVMLAAYTVTVVLFAFTPGEIASGFVDIHDRIVNPIAFPMGWRDIVQGVTELAGITVLLGTLLSVVSLVLRFRRADAEQRQQIRWLAYLAAFLGVWIVTIFTLEITGVIPENDDSVLGNVAFVVLIIGLFLGIPATCAIAILRYRLYELDVVVKKTVVAFLLVALVTAVALLVAIAIPTAVLGTGADRANVITVAVGVVIGLAISPFRRRARRWADRVVYGKRATPYEVLTEFGGRAAQTYSTDDVLPRMAHILASGTGASSSRVLLRVGGELREAASWRSDGEARGEEHVEPVVHQGEELGALAVTMAASDPMNPAKEKLVRDLAAQAGLVLRNARLIEELRASRQRLVAAQDEERRKIERDLHDGAQQQLVALAVQLKLARQMVVRDPGKAEELLESANGAAGEALEELRDLARGIYPPLLADRGLAAAVEAQARKAAVPVTTEANGLTRYPHDVEAAVYFCTLEALNNVAKYAGASRATVTLSGADGDLVFTVRDDGVGFDPTTTSRGSGLQGMADRLDSIGGELVVRSAPREGTTVTGRVPAPPGEAIP